MGSLTREAIEQRENLGPQIFWGTINFYSVKGDYGWISADQGQPLPPKFLMKSQEMTKKITDKGGKIDGTGTIVWFHKRDTQKDFRPQKGGRVQFKLYTNVKGAGAYDLESLSESRT